MTERPSLVVGLMSGTSLDGMDAALVRFSGPTGMEVLGFATRPYAPGERGLLEQGITGGGPADLARLHVLIGTWAAEAVDLLLQAANVPPHTLDLIAFHGQTVWHEPPVVSWQLGEPAILSERFGVRIVSQFRSRDVAAGGQGAPLVPLADVLLFGAEAAPRVLLNLGGMANLTYVPRRGVEEGAFGFDTGPGMAVIDALARRADPELPFDRDGVLSSQGSIHEDALAELLADPWFGRPPPKSTGREMFGQSYAESLARRVPGRDGVATAVALTVRSVSEAIRRWVPDGASRSGQAVLEVVVSGGGARHPGVMRSLAGVPGLEVRRFDDVFFDGEAKEAVAFALLGYLTVHGQPGNLPAATGAIGRRVLGVISPP